jgi:hypothetical protein
MIFTVYFQHVKMLKGKYKLYIVYNKRSFINSSFLQKADDFRQNHCLYQNIHNTAKMKEVQEYIEEKY